MGCVEAPGWKDRSCGGCRERSAAVERSAWPAERPLRVLACFRATQEGRTSAEEASVSRRRAFACDASFGLTSDTASRGATTDSVTPLATCGLGGDKRADVTGAAVSVWLCFVIGQLQSAEESFGYRKSRSRSSRSLDRRELRGDQSREDAPAKVRRGLRASRCGMLSLRVTFYSIAPME